MHYVYTLCSLKDKDLYVGRTNNLRRRLTEHNNGESFATAPRRPFVLVYYEAYTDEEDSVRREKSLKRRGQARVHLMKRIAASIRRAQN
ncbi:MAG TPA: GIY-YIG nuclease family protein [Candidatus Paceibacterota bacterium]|nr:GIY-YIG nuclease family protein [Candidatus Paceibacterota bacterium]